MKEEILKLRNEGKTYPEIAEILGCSKGTISYYCGEGQKEKTKVRTQKRRNITNNLPGKTDRFLRGAARHKVDRFQKRNGKQYKKGFDKSFSWKDVVDRFGEITECYLSGEKINLMKDKNYQFDHIIPLTRGGDCNIDNLGILHKTVNQMKNNLLNEEFIQWCKKILEHKGYKVTSVS